MINLGVVYELIDLCQLYYFAIVSPMRTYILNTIEFPRV